MVTEIVNTGLAHGLPEVVLALAALVLLLLGAYGGTNALKLVNMAAIAALVITGYVVLKDGMNVNATAWGGLYIVDAFANFFKLAILLGAGLSLLIARDYLAHHKINHVEYPVIVVLATTGMMMMVSANDLISLYMGLELQSLSLFILAAFRRDNLKASEAGLKYFLLGALSSGMTLYGSSLVYGFAGTTGFDGIASELSRGGDYGTDVGVIFGLAFVMAGVSFKVSAVPFHMWTPDVYEGAPTPVTAFFSAVPKLAAFGLLVRLVADPFAGLAHEWKQIVVFLSIASMLLGAFAAIVQSNIKRMLAYSSIGHVGYALIGVAAGTEEGLRGVFVYLAIYMVMTIGTFGCILAMKRDGHYVENISDLAGLSTHRPLLAGAFTIFMFSMAGVPPMSGFFGKFYVFMAAVNQNMFILAVVGLLASVVSAFYYLRVVKTIYFDDSKPVIEKTGSGVASVVGVTAIATLLFFLVPDWLLSPAGQAAASLVQ